MQIEKVEKRIGELQEYIDTYEIYQPVNMKEIAIRLYTEINNVNEVTNALNEKGYRKEGKLVAGKRIQVNLGINDVTAMLNCNIEDGDQLHPIVKKVLNKNKRRKGIVT